LDHANNSATKIQALGRRFLARLKFQRSYKKLVRDRNNRIRDRKAKVSKEYYNFIVLCIYFIYILTNL
jgi:hypothetical protein